MSIERSRRLREQDAKLLEEARRKAAQNPGTQYNATGGVIVESKLVSTSSKITDEQWKKLKKLFGWE